MLLPHKLCYTTFQPVNRTEKREHGGLSFYFRKVKRLIRHKRKPLPAYILPDSKIVFFIGTFNHYQTVSHLMNRAHNDIAFFRADLDKQYKAYFKEEFISKPAFIRSLLLIGLSELFYGKTKKLTLKDNRSGILKHYLAYEVFKNILKWSSTKAVVILNDHVPVYRAFMYAARKANVTSIFLPHASAHKDFPPLEFDYALLEGQDMVNKYQAIGVEGTEIKTIGNLKTDHFRLEQQKQPNNSRPQIGLAFNPMDSLEHVNQLLARLTGFVNLDELIIRPHPALQEKMDVKKAFPGYHLSITETTPDFLKKVNKLISGDSNIILEALLCDIPVLRYKFDRAHKLTDYYGLIRENLVPVAKSEEEAGDKLQDIHISDFTKEKLAYWDASLHNDYAGEANDQFMAFLNHF